MSQVALFDEPCAVDYTNAASASGRALLDWLRSIGALYADPQSKSRERLCGALAGDRWNRAVYRWRHDGSNVGFYTVDALCAQLGVHVSELPETVWRQRSAKDHRP